jgi:hypothetical protein
MFWYDKKYSLQRKVVSIIQNSLEINKGETLSKQEAPGEKYCQLDTIVYRWSVMKVHLCSNRN